MPTALFCFKEVSEIKPVILLLFLLSFFIAGCVFSSYEEKLPIDQPVFAEVETYNTKGNLMHAVFRRPPQRVVAVWQNSVETLLALGLKDHIVAALGVPYPECIKEEYRADYESIPLRQFKVLDTENILMLQPDFILAWYSTFTDKYTRSTNFWNSRGIHTFMAKSSMPNQKLRVMEDEYQYILDMGKIFGKENEAEKLVSQMNKEIRFVQRQTQNRIKPRTIIVELQKDRLMVYGKNTLAGDILARVNGALVDTGDTISYEQMIDADPEVVFLIVSEESYTSAGNLVQRFYDNPALQDISAVKNHRIYITPLFMVYSSATRMYDGIRLMAKGLYPDLYKEVSAVGTH